MTEPEPNAARSLPGATDHARDRSLHALPADAAGPELEGRARLGELLRGRRAIVGLSLVVAVYLAGVLPPALSLGTNVEELAGLLDTTPLREYADARPVEAVDTSAGPVLRESRWMPVYSVVFRDGTEFPLMVDGHIGAIPYWPYRPVLNLFGLTGARMVSVATGAFALVLMLLLGVRVHGRRVGWVATALLATTPVFIFLQAWVHPDESWSFITFMLGILVYLRWRDSDRRVHLRAERVEAPTPDGPDDLGHRGGLAWLLFAAFLFGLGVAAKNTASWSFLALAATAYLLDFMPKLSVGRWLLSGSVFLLPLLPQIVFVLLSPEAASFGRRTKMVAAPWEAFDPERLSFFAQHFTESYGGLGSYMGAFLDSDRGPSWPPIAGAGLLCALAIVGLVALSMRRRTPRPVRVLGVGLGLVMLQYVAFYYVGMSIFGLVTPWVPLAVAVAGVTLWDASARLRPGLARLCRGVVLTLGLVLLTNNVSQVVRYAVASVRPDFTIFDGRSQRALASDLQAAGVTRPWTTTYGIVGVLELLTEGAVAPVHAFPLFHTLYHHGYHVPWSLTLERMGEGTHAVLLTERPSELDVSPCTDGEAIADTLDAAVYSRGGQTRIVRSYPLASGETGFLWVEVTLPPSDTGPAESAPATSGEPEAAR